MIQRAIENDDCAEQTRSIPIWLYKEIRIQFRSLTLDLIETKAEPSSRFGGSLSQSHLDFLCFEASE